MTRLLISVMTPDEAETALSAGADVIDLKDPRAGALGALAPEVIRACLARIHGRAPVSATTGDHEATPEAVRAAAAPVAATGVDIVKIGLPPHERRLEAIRAAGAAFPAARLVAVLFADQGFDAALFAPLAEAGFAGVVIDTAVKSAGRLTDRMPLAALREAVARAHEAGLFIGLAGSLRLEDAAPLAALGPDLLGFRGAACRAGAGRTGALDGEAVRALKAAL